MPTRNYSSTAAPTSLTGAVTPGATTLTVGSSVGYPPPPFAAAVNRERPGQAEAMLVTAVSGLTWTVTRGFDGTTARDHGAGASIVHSAIALDHREAQQRLDVIEGTSTHKRGWTSSINVREYHLALQNGGETDWRRLARLEFASNDGTAASYTGATLTCEVQDSINSWGQNDPRTPLRQDIRITVSNTFTTSNAKTANISGDWGNYDFLRVVKVSDFVYEVHGRPSGHYYATNFRLRLLGYSGLLSIVYDEDSNGGPASVGTEYLFSGTQWRRADSRGWHELTGLLNGWAAYAGQTAIGAEWSPRIRKVNGIVHMAGLVAHATTGTTGTVVTLPQGFRPGSGTSMFHQLNNGASHRMDVRTDGQVVVSEYRAGSATGWVSLTSSWIAEN